MPLPEQRRLMGSEREYAFSVSAASGGPVSPDYGLTLLSSSMKRLFRGASDGSRTGAFFPGAQRFMVDSGGHPEISTAECTTPEQCVAAIAAGDRMLAAAAADVRRRLGENIQVFAGRGCIDYVTSTTWGNHDSFMLSGRETPLVPERLVPYLVSRLVITGAGGWDPDCDGLRFVLSPRALKFSAVVSSCSTENRPIYHFRGEPLCQGFSRVHTILAEGLGSHWGAYLRVASASLILRLIERGALSGGALTLDSPVAALHQISRDPTLKRKVKLSDGRELSAIEIQRCYLDEVETELSRGNLPPWAATACDRWRWTLDQLSVDSGRLAGVLDWRMKLDMFDRVLEEHGTSVEDLARWRWPRFSIGSMSLDRARALRAEMLALDVRFGQIGEEGIFDQLDRAGLLNHSIPEVTDETVESAITHPPEGSRAVLRGRILSQPGAAGRYRVNWDHILDLVQRRVVDMSDPFTDSESWTSVDEARRSPVEFLE